MSFKSILDKIIEDSKIWFLYEIFVSFKKVFLLNYLNLYLKKPKNLNLVLYVDTYVFGKLKTISKLFMYIVY